MALVTKEEGLLLLNETEEIMVEDLIDECLGIKSVLAERFDVTLHTDMEDGAATLNGNRRLLRAVLDNLIDDAIKRIGPGGDIVVIQRVDERGVIIGISHNGGGTLGMESSPSSCHVEIFFPDGILDEKRANERGQISMGLSMVKRVTNMHGGRVGFLFREGERSCLGICLPLCR
jgi:signal transduction histidine kinase